ncbi:MAG: 4a-hydroxytetrahydrobiopterin dehydratase [Saprospiraceae bacterium]|nr:4a-hydroxytetrahydrobiopterin dehydratase [Saprospiraceae bacterium]
MMSWIEKDHSLEKTFEFTDFKHAMAFMTECALHVEQINHHPTWSNTYNTVHVKLHTHDAEYTVTEKDRKLADIMDKVYKKYDS